MSSFGLLTVALLAIAAVAVCVKGAVAAAEAVTAAGAGAEAVGIPPAVTGAVKLILITPVPVDWAALGAAFQAPGLATVCCFLTGAFGSYSGLPFSCCALQAKITIVS